MGNLTDYLFVFTGNPTVDDPVVDFNWQGATKGYQGNVAVNGDLAGADLRTSGDVPYKGTIYTNAAGLDDWQSIVNDNRPGGSFPANNSTAAYNEDARITGLQGNLGSAFTQVNALAASAGYSSVAATSLNGLNTQNGISETFVINITSGLQVSTKINITGDPGDVFIMRWDEDANFGNGYDGQVKFQSGGAIVPLGGLTPSSFIHVAGDINASGGGAGPVSPYPQGVPIDGGAPFNGGGFFTGYWLTTGDPTKFETSSLSNAIFVGGWYTSTVKFSLTSGSSGVYVPPNVTAVPLPGAMAGGLVLMGTLGVFRRVRSRPA